jgi:anti-sigma B factor antagonist
MLDIHLDDEGNVKLSGRFDAAQVDKAEEVFSHVHDDCSVDCAELEYISSAGLGVFITAYKRLFSEKKHLRLVNLKQNVRQILHYAGLDQILAVEQG